MSYCELRLNSRKALLSFWTWHNHTKSALYCVSNLYSDTNGIFSAPKYCFGVVCSVDVRLVVFLTLTMSVKMWCAGGLLSSVVIVCVQTLSRWFSWKHLSHSLDCFITAQFQSSLWSSGVDPESFVCNRIPMQVLSCDHLAPHHCWVEGQPGTEISGERSNLFWMCRHQPRDWIEGDNGDMTNPCWTITAFSYSRGVISLSHTGLLGYISVCTCNCIAMITGERQGYWMFIQMVW